MRPMYVVRITPEDVGSRVTIRHRLPAGEEASFSDVVGVLESWADGMLRLRRRDGSVTTIAEDALVAGKVMPPAPPRRRPREG